MQFRLKWSALSLLKLEYPAKIPKAREKNDQGYGKGIFPPKTINPSAETFLRGKCPPPECLQRVQQNFENNFVTK